VKTRIREYRKIKGITQQQLAERVGVRRETIVHLERGAYNPSLLLAHDIAETLGVSIENLFIFEE
jgi:putative transcriptional regulator